MNTYQNLLPSGRLVLFCGVLITQQSSHISEKNGHDDNLRIGGFYGKK